ncbi:MAG TPA: class I SAM-dependent methyltransferase [Chloroflexota bacterium]|nr:class I SAM-dependent methyltransferase [Chloroflexota bacterium]
MGYQIDPEGNETRVLHALIDFRDKDVLEIGCGDGRMTWRYAAHTRSVLALDPNAARIEQAIASTPDALKPVVTFRVADIAKSSLPERAFDLAVLSWSL